MPREVEGSGETGMADKIFKKILNFASRKAFHPKTRRIYRVQRNFSLSSPPPAPLPCDVRFSLPPPPPPPPSLRLIFSYSSSAIISTVVFVATRRSLIRSANERKRRKPSRSEKFVFRFSNLLRNSRFEKLTGKKIG